MKPEEQIVQIVSEPRVDVTFEQFLASVSGTVECLGGFGRLNLTDFVLHRVNLECMQASFTVRM